MQHVDRNLLMNSLPDRVAFLRSFIGFSKKDGETLNSAAPLVVPLAKGVVDAVYDHLFLYDYTTDPFTHRNKGFEGDLTDIKEISESGSSSLLAPPSIAELGADLCFSLVIAVDSPQIAFRKKFLTYSELLHVVKSLRS